MMLFGRPLSASLGGSGGSAQVGGGAGGGPSARCGILRRLYRALDVRATDWTLRCWFDADGRGARGTPRVLFQRAFAFAFRCACDCGCACAWAVDTACWRASSSLRYRFSTFRSAAVRERRLGTCTCTTSVGCEYMLARLNEADRRLRVAAGGDRLRERPYESTDDLERWWPSGPAVFVVVVVVVVVVVSMILLMVAVGCCCCNSCPSVLVISR